MDDFISHYFPILRHLFVISECKNRKKRRWILTKEYLLPLETYEDDNSFAVTDNSNSDIYLRLKYAYNAAKLGIKEGVLTGFFFGGVWGILKEVNDFSFGSFENVKNANDDEKDVKVTNQSFTVIKSFEFSKQYSSTTEVISIMPSISKSTLFTESMKNYNNISPLDVFVRNNVKNQSECKNCGTETNSVKNVFQHSDFYSKTNHFLQSLYPEVPNFYSKNSFGIRKNRDRVEIVGCALIQTNESMNSDSDSSENVSDTKSEDFEVKKMGRKREKFMLTFDERNIASRTVESSNQNKTVHPNLKPSSRMTNLRLDKSEKRIMTLPREGSTTMLNEKSKTMINEKSKTMMNQDMRYSDSYKASVLNNIPESCAFDEYEETSDREIKIVERQMLNDRQKNRRGTFKASGASTQTALPPEFLEKYMKDSKNSKIESRKKKLPYLVNIEEVSNGYNSDKTPPESAPKNIKKRTMSSERKAFLEEIKKLRENLINEPGYQSSGEISSENSYVEIKDSVLGMKRRRADSFISRDGVGGNTKANKSDEKKLEESHPVEKEIVSSIHTPEPQVVPVPRKRKSSNVSTTQNQETEIVPVPRKRRLSMAPSHHGSEVVPAPRKNVSTKEPEKSEVVATSKQMPSASRKPFIRALAPILVHDVSKAHKEKESSDTLTPQSQTAEVTAVSKETPASTPFPPIWRIPTKVIIPEYSSSRDVNKKKKYVDTSASNSHTAEATTQSATAQSASTQSAPSTAPPPSVIAPFPVVVSEAASEHKEEKSDKPPSEATQSQEPMESSTSHTQPPKTPAATAQPAPPPAPPPLIIAPVPVVIPKDSRKQKQFKSSPPQNKVPPAPAPESERKRPSTSPTLHPPQPDTPTSPAPAPKITPAVRRTKPRVSQISESEKKEKQLSVSSDPTRYCSGLVSNVNDNYIFINACNCALVIGIICCGLSAVKASFFVLN